MQCGGIEIGAIGPHQRVCIGVEYNLIESRKVAKGTVHLACKYRQKIDRLFRAVVKSNPDRVRPVNLKLQDAADQM